MTKLLLAIVTAFVLVSAPVMAADKAATGMADSKGKKMTKKDDTKKKDDAKKTKAAKK